MKESTKEDLANHFGHESYADDGNVVGVATAVGYAGKLLSSVPHPYRVPTLSVLREDKMFQYDIGKRWNGSAESKNLSMRRNFHRENREIPEISASASNHAIVERSENAPGGTADMVASGKSDDFVVPTKLANKTRTPAAESMEGRRSRKSSCVRFAIAPDTVPDHAVRANGHARHVAMDSSRPSRSGVSPCDSPPVVNALDALFRAGAHRLYGSVCRVSSIYAVSEEEVAIATDVIQAWEVLGIDHRRFWIRSAELEGDGSSLQADSHRNGKMRPGKFRSGVSP